MAKQYDYVIDVSMGLGMKDSAPRSLDELKEYLQEQYQIEERNPVWDMLGIDPDKLNEDDDGDDELTASLRLQVTFDESQMNGVEPTDEALEELHAELTAYLETKYQVNYLSLEEGFLLSEQEDDD